MAKRRPEAKSMDLICVSDNLGAAYMGFQVLEREKKAFMQSGDVKAQPKLDDYKHLVGAYLKPQINPQTIKQLEESEIMPSYGYLVTRGLADAVRRLVRDSGMGAKVYIDKLPFAGKTFDLGKEMNIDPMSAALNGGEDYRLLFTIPIGKHDKFRHDFQTFDIIGHLAKPEVGAVVVTPDGVELPMKAQGWNNE
jgi:thiamine-monophosphate kinase